LLRHDLRRREDAHKTNALGRRELVVKDAPEDLFDRQVRGMAPPPSLRSQLPAIQLPFACVMWSAVDQPIALIRSELFSDGKAWIIFGMILVVAPEQM